MKWLFQLGETLIFLQLAWMSILKVAIVESARSPTAATASPTTVSPTLFHTFSPTVPVNYFEASQV